MRRLLGLIRLISLVLVSPLDVLTGSDGAELEVGETTDKGPLPKPEHSH